MNAKECNQRASDCVDNAAAAHDESISLEFLKIAALWRAMAVRDIFLGHVVAPTRRADIANPRTLTVG